MAKYTTYKNLEKPLSTEKYNIGIANKNNDVIDSELHKLDLKNKSQDELLATKEDLNSEISRASTKENAILQDLESEIERAKENENTVFDLVINETNRASMTESNIQENLFTHISDQSNPHNVTAEQLNLENVDNTADINKPVSKAQQAAIDLSTSNHNTSTSSHDDIRALILELTTRLNTLADSDDTTLDQLSEIVSYIKNNKDLIDNITTNKINVSDIIDTLTSNAIDRPLSANQGKILNDKKVDKVYGKGLSTNDYTTDEKNKLKNIASGAEVNIQSDWNETDETSSAFIKNKPDIQAAETLKNALKFTGFQSDSYDGSTEKSIKIPRIYIGMSEIDTSYNYTNFSYNMLPKGSILYCTINSIDKENAFNSKLIPISSTGVITAVNANSRGYAIFTTDAKRMFFAYSSNMSSGISLKAWIEITKPIVYETEEPSFLYPDMTWIGN